MAASAAAAASGSESLSAAVGRRARSLLTHLLLVLVPVALYYGAVITRQEHDASERAIRALREMQRAYDNYLQASIGLPNWATNQGPGSAISKALNEPFQASAQAYYAISAFTKYRNLGWASFDDGFSPDSLVRAACSRLDAKLDTTGRPPQAAALRACKHAEAQAPNPAPASIDALRAWYGRCGGDDAEKAGDADRARKEICDAFDALTWARDPNSEFRQHYAAVVQTNSTCDTACWRRLFNWVDAFDAAPAAAETEIDVTERGARGEAMGVIALDGYRACRVAVLSRAPTQGAQQRQLEAEPRYACQASGASPEALIDFSGETPAFQLMPCNARSSTMHLNRIAPAPAPEIWDFTGVDRHGCDAAAGNVSAISLAERNARIDKQGFTNGLPTALMYSIAAWRPMQRFEHLAEFQTVIVATGDGQPLAVESQRRDDREMPWSAQRNPHTLGPFADVGELLRIAALDGWIQARSALGGGSDGRSMDGAVSERLLAAAERGPGRVVEFRHTIGGQRYSVMLLPYRPPIPMFMPGHPGMNDAQQARPEAVPVLWFIGLRPVTSLGLSARNIDPYMSALLLLLASTFCVLLPQLRLWLMDPRESIGRWHARALALSLALLMALGGCAVLAAAALSAHDISSRQRTIDYASALQAQIRAGLGEALALLGNARLAFDDTGGLATPSKPLPALLAGEDDGLQPAWALRRRTEVAVEPVAATSDAAMPELRLVPCQDALFDDIVLFNRLWLPGPTQGYGSWSPLNLIGTVLPRGAPDHAARMGPQALSSFQCRSAFPRVQLDYRQYYRMIVDDAAWNWPAGASETPGPYVGPYVAQRLFNRTDGSRTLQLAIPWPARDIARGVLTGDTAFFELTAAVAPPGLGFAVFDRDTGNVVFHSDDSRALVENFISETESHPRLLAALQTGIAADFSGDYRGAAHGIHVEDVPNTRWALAVFYRKSPMVLAALLASIATMTVYLFLLGLALLLLFGLATAIPDGCGWAWPQARLAPAYRKLFRVLLVHAFATANTLLIVPRELLPWALLFGPFMFLPALGAAALVGNEPPGLGRHRRIAWLAVALSLVATALFTLGGWRGLDGALGPDAPRLTAAYSLFRILLSGAALALCAHWLRGLVRIQQAQLQTTVTLGAVRSVNDPWTHDPLDGQRVPPVPGRPAAHLRPYRHCALVALFSGVIIPVAALFSNAYGWQIRGSETALTLDLRAQFLDRYQTVQGELHRLVNDDALRAAQFPTAWALSRLLPAPGIALSAGARNDRAICIGAEAALAWHPAYAHARACRERYSAALRPPPHDLVAQASYTLALLEPDNARAAQLGWSSAENPEPALAPAPDGQAIELGLPDAAPGGLLAMAPPATNPEAGQWWLTWICAALLLPGLGYLLLIEFGRRLYGGACGNDPDLGWHPTITDAQRLQHAQQTSNGLLRWFAEGWRSGENDDTTPGGAPTVGHWPRMLMVDLDTLTDPPKIVAEIDGLRREFLGLPLYRLLTELQVRRRATRIVDLCDPDGLTGVEATAELDGGVVWLSHFDRMLHADPAARKALLGQLEWLLARRELRVVLSMDFSPVALLCEPGSMPAGEGLDLDEAEAARWCMVFGQLRPVSLSDEIQPPPLTWPAVGIGDPRLPVLAHHIDAETRLLWPCLQPIRDELWQQALQRPDSLDARTIQRRVLQNAGGVFRRLWRHCTLNERVLLHSLALGEHANPGAGDTLERLRQRGLLTFAPGPALASGALRDFVLTAEAPETFADWRARQVSQSWTALRVPLALFALLLLGWFAYSAGGLFKVLLALLSSIALFAGNLTSVVNFARGQKS